ncbi:hypothetical protein [Dysgonomonas capnocytophagoides]|uniref:hypothetical protein n=1 Tax=Dysgonomonas capnocytophagoides TaxID=45254 RepID=UPI003340C829
MNKMTIKTVLVMILSVSLFGACQTNQKKEQNMEAPVKEANAPDRKEIPFIVADRYFVNNTVKSIDNPKITTKEEFDSLFGMATAMGTNGLPTEIDFTKQYVIAVVKPETDYSTTLVPVSLQKNEKGEIVFSYKISKGEKQTYQIRPCLIVIVNKEATGDVVLKEVE